jgi:hypothetical protein
MSAESALRQAATGSDPQAADHWHACTTPHHTHVAQAATFHGSTLADHARDHCRGKPLPQLCTSLSRLLLHVGDGNFAPGCTKGRLVLRSQHVSQCHQR